MSALPLAPSRAHLGFLLAPWVKLLLVLLLLTFATQPFAQPDELVNAVIEIGQVTPAPAIVGQSFTVPYRVRNVSKHNVTVTGNIVGTYGGTFNVPSTNGVPTNITVAPNAAFDGSLSFTASDAGTASVSVSLVTCQPGRGLARMRCLTRATKVLASAEVDVVVIQEMVHMRVPGLNFLRLDAKDKLDHAKVKNGFLCVEHNPGCGVQGNDGTDGFYPVFPPGAVYEGVDFDRYWPDGVSSDRQGFPINDSGSYDARLAYARPDDKPPAFPYVRWHNTCLQGSPARGKSVYYAISFRVLVPKGTDLGPDAKPVDQSKASTCSAFPDFGIKFESLKVTPNYVNGGTPVQIEWKIRTYGNCVPDKLVLFSRLYQQDKVKIGTPSPLREGKFGALAPSESGFIGYSASVECQGVPSSNVASEEVFLQVPPSGGVAKAPYLKVDGPVITPSPPIEKAPFTVQWTIQNTGTAEAPEFKVRLYLDNQVEGDEQDVPKLSPGASKSLQWSVTKEIVGSPHQVELRNTNGASLGFGQFTVNPAPPKPAPNE